MTSGWRVLSLFWTILQKNEVTTPWWRTKNTCTNSMGLVSPFIKSGVHQMIFKASLWVHNSGSQTGSGYNSKAIQRNKFQDGVISNNSITTINYNITTLEGNIHLDVWFKSGDFIKMHLMSVLPHPGGLVTFAGHASDRWEKQDRRAGGEGTGQVRGQDKSKALRQSWFCLLLGRQWLAV